MDKQSYISHKPDGWYVYSEAGKRLGGPYSKESEAKKRLSQIHYFKTKGKKSSVDGSLTLFMMNKEARGFGRGLLKGRPGRTDASRGYEYLRGNKLNVPGGNLNPNILNPYSDASVGLRLWGTPALGLSTAGTGGLLLLQKDQNKHREFMNSLPSGHIPPHLVDNSFPERASEPVNPDVIEEIARNKRLASNKRQVKPEDVKDTVAPEGPNWFDRGVGFIQNKPWHAAGIGLGTLGTALLLRKLLGPKEPTEEELLERLMASGQL
jgi:hypothetical protein